MARSIVLLAGLALLAAVLEAAIADSLYDYTVTGFENASGTITPLTGFIDVDATSGDTARSPIMISSQLAQSSNSWD